MNSHCMLCAKYKIFEHLFNVRYIQLKLSKNNAKINTVLELLPDYLKIE